MVIGMEEDHVIDSDLKAWIVTVFTGYRVCHERVRRKLEDINFCEARSKDFHNSTMLPCPAPVVLRLELEPPNSPQRRLVERSPRLVMVDTEPGVGEPVLRDWEARRRPQRRRQSTR